MGEEGERRTALLGRLIGLEVPPELVPESDDPERMREAFFSALRSGIEAWAREKPLVFAFEDIHWADDGMLDAIEHLAQWVRAPLLIVCLARDELLDRRPGWGGGRRSATQLMLDPLGAADTESLVAALLPGSGVARARGGGALRRQPAVRGGDGAPDRRGGRRTPPSCPTRCRACSPRGSTRSSPFERRLVQQAAVVGRTFWEGSLMPLARSEGRDLGRALISLQEKDILAPGAEGRLAGERELAFKHVLIRDVAYGMLPKAVRARKHFEVGLLHRGARRRPDRRGRPAARRALRPRRRARPRGRAARRTSCDGMQRRAMLFLEQAGDAGAQLFSNREAASHYRHARKICPRDAAGDMARIGEKLGDVSLRLGRVDEAIGVWLECLEWHRGQEDLERVADLHRKIGAALSHKGERKAAIEHYQKGINLLKDGPPRIELVRLYEEAAWLYLHTGDNMLAIYASEKALRLAERLGETRAASRAHGIFGRVFGRIGDTEKARQNLERAVELARGSDRGETILALSALGRHLEVSEAKVGRRARPTRRRSRWPRRWACCRRRSSCTRRWRSWPCTAPTGSRSSAPPRRAPSWPSARGWWASSASHTRCAGCCAGARATSGRPPCCSTAPTSWPSRSAGRSSPSRRCSACRRRCATRATSPARPLPSTARSTCASARA